MKAKSIILAVLACCFILWMCVSCLKLVSPYLVRIEPFPQRITFNGQDQPLTERGSFIFREIAGEHIVTVYFKSGKRVDVAVYPRLSDDDSCQLEISEDGVLSRGDLRYKILSAENLPKSP